MLAGITAEVRIEPGAEPSQGRIYRDKQGGCFSPGGVALVLGAENISAIAPRDLVHKLCVDDEVVVLKMHPLNEYLGPLFERAFAPLIEGGFLRIVYGGADVGSYLCSHELVSSIHLTGSHHTHDAIVWGTGEGECQRRKAAGTPAIDKRVTSELGCVSPVIVVPGEWRDAELEFQARSVAGMVTHNASFNCTAAKALVVHDRWRQRERFVERLSEILAKTPQRNAYYPGAADRYQRFCAEYPEARALGPPAPDGRVPRQQQRRQSSPSDKAARVGRMSRRMELCCLIAAIGAALWGPSATAQDPAPRIFISVDMEGIGGIGTAKMVSGAGKDYGRGRELMTAEVNAVVEAIFAHGPAEVLVNDSHGDMQNLLHTQLDERVQYIQGNIKPLGMVQGLDSTFDGAIFLGYHARAGTPDGFLAHTGSGSVKGLWLNGVEVGEGGLNAHFAGAQGVPVILAAGDLTFTQQFAELVDTRTVATKEAIGSSVAKLLHPDIVRGFLREATAAALDDLPNATPLPVTEPVVFRIRFASTTRADILQAIPGVRRVDGTTVEYDARTTGEAYGLIRLMYKYVSW